MQVDCWQTGRAPPSGKGLRGRSKNTCQHIVYAHSVFEVVLQGPKLHKSVNILLAIVNTKNELKDLWVI
jgi:hypothetical protein